MYFFRVHDVNDNTVNEHGAEFANDKRACIEAMWAAREVVVDTVANGGEVIGISFELARYDGTTIDKIELTSVLHCDLLSARTL